MQMLGEKETIDRINQFINPFGLIVGTTELKQLTFVERTNWDTYTTVNVNGTPYMHILKHPDERTPEDYVQLVIEAIINKEVAGKNQE